MSIATGGYGSKQTIATWGYSSSTLADWFDFTFENEPPIAGTWNKVLFETEPPTANSWNKVKRN